MLMSGPGRMAPPGKRGIAVMANFIPLSVPNFCGNEKKYVDDALEGAWVSTSGAKVGDMEKAVADYVHMPRAVAANSGTSALHLSAMAAGIRRGDEVLVPALKDVVLRVDVREKQMLFKAKRLNEVAVFED